MKTRFALALFLGLCACQAPTVPPFTVTDFSGIEPVSVGVSSLYVQDKTPEYGALPHLESQLPIKPATALKQALSNRYRAVSPASADDMVLEITEASLTQKQSPTEHWYTWDNIEYLLSYEIVVTYMHNGQPEEIQTVVGWEKQALPRNSSLLEKEQAWQKMINAMIDKSSRKIITDIPDILKR